VAKNVGNVGCYVLVSGSSLKAVPTDGKLTRYQETYLPDHYKRQLRGVEAALGRGAKEK
jgi:hypothetical protein